MLCVASEIKSGSPSPYSLVLVGGARCQRSLKSGQLHNRQTTGLPETFLGLEAPENHWGYLPVYDRDVVT